MADAEITVDVELDRVDLLDMVEGDEIHFVSDDTEPYPNIRISLSDNAKRVIEDE